jgi:hypothetical protein
MPAYAKRGYRDKKKKRIGVKVPCLIIFYYPLRGKNSEIYKKIYLFYKNCQDNKGEITHLK